MPWLDCTARPRPVRRQISGRQHRIGAGTELDAVVGTGVAGAGEEGTTLCGGDGDTALGGGDGSEVDSQAVDCFPTLETVDAGDGKRDRDSTGGLTTAGTYGGDGGTTAGGGGAAMRT